MNVRHRPTRVNRRPVFVATIFILALWVPPVSAQLGRNRSLESKNQRNAEQMREVEIKRLENGIKGTSISNPVPSLPYLQIREDFRQIQIVHNEMMASAFSTNPTSSLDYRSISKATAEINKRAARLKSTLRLPRPETEEALQLKKTTTEAELKVSLLALDDHVMKFVMNPSFGHAGVVDADESAKASRDLARIIDLARHIRDNSEKLAHPRN